MIEKLTPVNEYLVIIPSEIQTQTESGLYLPEGSKELLQTGKVVSTTGHYIAGTSEWTDSWFSSGDVILFNKYVGLDVKTTKGTRVLVKESDILAIVETNDYERINGVKEE